MRYSQKPCYQSFHKCLHFNSPSSLPSPPGEGESVRKLLERLIHRWKLHILVNMKTDSSHRELKCYPCLRFELFSSKAFTINQIWLCLALIPHFNWSAGCWQLIDPTLRQLMYYGQWINITGQWATDWTWRRMRFHGCQPWFSSYRFVARLLMA